MTYERTQRDLTSVPAETLVGLQNLLVHLRDVSAENVHLYQYRLWDAKRVKVETAQNRRYVGPNKAAHRQFEAKRKSHYSEFYAVKLARQLMEKDEELLEAESEEGAGPSSAAGPSSSSAEPAPAPDSAPSTSS
ncbi:hypothetical protein FJT64_001669 [Amphibalanus amphitrite]|uniref:Uncharacterized protein n=1 Tax=Amphibalanus amphitrite TaxID=1232801 RepID=A0A6A4X1G0_AMPAM|nr:hypothetical protein FJT64_001669 [Amphibalanus amphitrite]